MPFLAPARTLILPYPSAAPGFGSEPAQLVLPDVSSADIVASGLDLSAWLARSGETFIGTPIIVVSPAGDDTDLVASIGTYFPGAIAAWTATGGIPGTIYKIEIQAGTISGSAGRFSVLQYVDFDSPAVAPGVAPPPPSGQITMWVCSGLVAAGTDLASAFQMTCVTNIFGTVPSGTGARLPKQSFEPLPVTIQHEVVGGNALLIYPPDAASSINGLASGLPVSLDAPLAPFTTDKIDFHYLTSSSPFLIVT